MRLIALIFDMSYVKYFKDFIILAIIVLSLISMKKNQTEIGKLKLQVDNLKNNLYQTNEVIGNMQSHLAESK